MNTQTTKTFWKTTSLFGLLAFAPMFASAHPGHGPANSFAGGFSHPLLGLDHILTMVAVGLWAAQMGGRALWAVPASFVGLMSVGGMLGMMGMRMPMVEAGILASVVILGLLIATSVRLPLVGSMALVGMFAIFHGFAHGTEIPVAASGLAYGIGFVLATSALHLCGIGLGFLAQKQFRAPALRYAGAAIALAGVCLWVG
jgi:urease accessory protein